MIEVPAIRTTRTRYPEEVKALAFELYAYQCAQDMPATIAALNKLTDNPVSEKSIYAWRSEQQWDKRILAEQRAMAPVSWERWCQGISVAGPLAISRLSSIMDNPDARHQDQIAAARTLAQLYADHADFLLAMAQDTETPDDQIIEHTPGWTD